MILIEHPIKILGYSVSIDHESITDGSLQPGFIEVTYILLRSGVFL
jgi:hypothetical protein